MYSKGNEKDTKIQAHYKLKRYREQGFISIDRILKNSKMNKITMN